MIAILSNTDNVLNFKTLLLQVIYSARLASNANVLFSSLRRRNRTGDWSGIRKDYQQIFRAIILIKRQKGQ